MDNIDTEKQLIALQCEAKRLEEDTTYSSKGHYNAASRWECCNLYLGVPATILAAVAAGSTLVEALPGLTIFCTLIVSILTGLMTFLSPNERATLHRSAAGRLLALRKEVLFFRNIELLQGRRLSELSEKLRALIVRENELNQNSPTIPKWAFLKARKGIEQGEATYKVDKENG